MFCIVWECFDIIMLCIVCECFNILPNDTVNKSNWRWTSRIENRSWTFVQNKAINIQYGRISMGQ